MCVHEGTAKVVAMHSIGSKSSVKEDMGSSPIRCCSICSWRSTYRGDQGFRRPSTSYGGFSTKTAKVQVVVNLIHVGEAPEISHTQISCVFREPTPSSTCRKTCMVSDAELTVKFELFDAVRTFNLLLWITGRSIPIAETGIISKNREEAREGGDRDTL
ncbi:hypothetical protein C8R44DRAFT_743865 [Mycena epipterygia]|nr:hypothetical protein C8R44DRAFT_743865 [Mycena epipterygia]